MTILTKVIVASGKGLDYRLVEDRDKSFLRELYATTRAAEMAMVPWSDEQKDEFVEMQFNAQHTFYFEQFKNAEFGIISKNNLDIGRLYLDRRDDEVRIIDIALHPTYQRLGIGERLLNAIIQYAQERELPVTIHVEKNNPAMSLYLRLGFELIEDQGVYDLMQWSASNTKGISD